MAKAKPLNISEEERSQLETITRTRTLQAQVVSRARILLLKAEDNHNIECEDSKLVNPTTQRKISRLYQEYGI